MKYLISQINRRVHLNLPLFCYALIYCQQSEWCKGNTGANVNYKGIFLMCSVYRAMIVPGVELEQALGDGVGQGSLACCGPWSRRVEHDWVTEKTYKPARRALQQQSKTLQCITRFLKSILPPVTSSLRPKEMQRWGSEVLKETEPLWRKTLPFAGELSQLACVSSLYFYELPWWLRW